MGDRPYGFIAFWKATDAWYSATDEVKDAFMKDLIKINMEAKEKGVVTYGNFDCSWSCEWRYFTFWMCEELEVLQETMEKLVEIGDINHFNIQHHYIGRKTVEEFVQ